MVIFDKITTFSNIEMFRVISNRDDEFVFSTHFTALLEN